MDKMRAAGYDVSTQEFSFPFFEELSQAQFSRISPEPRTFAATDFRTMTFAEDVDVTAAVTLVDVRLPAPGDLNNLSTSGSEANDFTGFPVGNIALVQRGTCAFADKAKISLSLNFDMVGSPNFMRGVYDGDGSSFGLKGPAGSAQIEGVFNKHFADKGLALQGTELSGPSDYQAFINCGIPAGGLFTGAEGLKATAEAAAYGGVAGAAYDPCDHKACDNLTGAGSDAALYSRLPNRVGNDNTVALDTNSDAIAHSVITYAYDTSAVKGVRNPGKSHGQAKGTPGRTDGCSRDWLLRSNI